MYTTFVFFLYQNGLDKKTSSVAVAMPYKRLTTLITCTE